MRHIKATANWPTISRKKNFGPEPQHCTAVIAPAVYAQLQDLCRLRAEVSTKLSELTDAHYPRSDSVDQAPLTEAQLLANLEQLARTWKERDGAVTSAQTQGLMEAVNATWPLASTIAEGGQK